MTPAHGHPGPGPAGVVTAVAALQAAVLYLAAAVRLRRRGDVWPRWRDASFTAGSACLAWAAVGSPPGGPFTAHMVRHLTVGMTAPLLFVLARPLTLALRALPPGAARGGLLSLAHSRAAGRLLFPPLAALLDAGGLWLLYRTDLFARSQEVAWLNAVVHAHVLAAGLLFTFSVCLLDPVRRRYGLAVRGTTLLAAGAAHAVLAKGLCATGPPGAGVAPADLRTGAQVMYYGGDLAEAALAVVLAGTWYAAAGRAHGRRRRAAEQGLARPEASTAGSPGAVG